MGYFHTHEKQLARQGVNVKEWDRASKGKKLPKHARKVIGKKLKKALNVGE